jgi:hypothetical protein
VSFIGPISVPDSCTSIDISGKLATETVKSLEEGSPSSLTRESLRQQQYFSTIKQRGDFSI